MEQQTIKKADIANEGEILQGYRKSKYGLIPMDWEIKKVKDILQRIKKPVDVLDDENYREIGIRSHGKGIFYKEIIKGKQLGNKAVFWVEPDCFIVNIVFAWELAVAQTKENDLGFIASHRFPMYKAIEGHSDIDYITYLFKSPIGKHLLNLASPGGAGRNKTLGQKEFLDLDIPVPKNVREQKKIAEILFTWDKAIQLKENLIERKKEQKKGIAQKLLTGESRLPGFQAEWKLSKLKSLCSKIIDGTHSTPKYTESGVPFYSVENVTKRNFIKHKYISEQEHLSISSRCKVEKGDILMTRIGSIGDAVLVDWEHESSIYVSLALIKTSEDILSSYLVQYMSTNTFKKSILSRSLLSAIPQKINLAEIGNIDIYFPTDLLEQTAINNILSKADKEIFLLEKELEALKQQKKGLIQLLLTGKVRVKV